MIKHLSQTISQQQQMNWAIPEKNKQQGRGMGVEDMEFPGVLKNSQVLSVSWGFNLIKNNGEFQQVIKRKSCGISRGCWFTP